MNAYELADKLNEWYNFSHENMCNEAAQMLRQQADRIAELEKEVKRLVGAEPITHGKLTFCVNCGQQDSYVQTKPLSDVQISLIAEEFTGADGLDVVDFGRAIEERHGIK